MPSFPAIPALPSSLTSSKQALIATTAAVSVATTALSIYTVQALRRSSRREALRKDVKRAVGQQDLNNLWDESDPAVGPGAGQLDEMDKEVRRIVKERERQGDKSGGKKTQFSEELIREQLARNYVFLGDEAMVKVRNSYVVIVGCGGVGSWAALMLLRSGVSKIMLVDFDLTTLSSLNRHACATLADVGTPKVQTTKKFLEKVAPWATIEAKVALWRDGPEGAALLEGADWVIDAIDNITTKSQLLVHCKTNGIKVFSSMGAGAKSDPTRVQIADISNTTEDPLARSIRRNLRLGGVASGIPVVFSTEVPAEVKLLPLPEDEFKKGNVKELGAFDDFRVRILPVLGPLPAIFGLTIATYVLQDLAGKPILQSMENKNRKKIYSKLYNDLTIRESKFLGIPEGHRIPLDFTSISLIYEELHQCGRSVLPSPISSPFLPLIAHPVCQRPALVRWDLGRPLSVDNCVLMEVKEADRHQHEFTAGRTLEEVYGEDVVKGVEALRKESRRILSWMESRAD
ncbi:ubiquitin-protein ligase molybdopterin-converting factor [Phaffia rhodozyma]|uniref:Ubiquitin-protein ligase molybdopterin-converting factor n=1 Tax=Phaffia rhodozyma TaxID=264483 RepID=A0A0F7SIN1_PHARH|nr:ubiquitin-protein ligase molybdopterin-converting factor [Phaffia rhodozyma]